MTSAPLWISQELLVMEAMKLMQNPQKWITLLPVLESQKVVGVIRMHDIVQAGIS